MGTGPGETKIYSMIGFTMYLLFTGEERYDLEEEVESFTEHPVEGGEVEEVGEGEGRAQQGLRQLRWQL